MADQNDNKNDNQPARQESGDALISVTAPVRVKKVFRDEEDEGELNQAEPEATDEGAEPEYSSDEQSSEDLDELLSGAEPPVLAAAREAAVSGDQHGLDADDAQAAAEAERALVKARDRDGMAKLNESPLHRKKTELLQKLMKGIRLNRAEASAILSFMHPYLIALGIWQHWCEDVVGIPVKTADRWRIAHDARQKLPPQLLAAVSGINVDISKPKVSNLMIGFGDEFYEGEVSEARIAEMMALLQQAMKREPSKPASTAPAPSASLVTVHDSGDGESTGSGASETPEPDPDPDPDPEPKPKPKQVKFTPGQYEEFEAIEEKLRPYLGTTDMAASVLAAFRRLQQMSLFELALTTPGTSEAKKEVLGCV